MAVYVDVMFLRELLVDGSLLLTTAWVRHMRASPWRVLSASAIGACYVVMMLYPQLSVLFTLLVKVSVSLLMIWVAFGFVSLQHFLRNIAAFYTVNFVAAGAIIGIHYLLMQGSGEVWRTVNFIKGGMQVELKMGLIYLLAAFCIGLYIYRTVLTQRRERELVQTHLAEVIISIDELEQRCIGLVDTGNQLYDPLTRTPVMVVEASLWSEQLPASWLQCIREEQVDRLVAGLGEDHFDWQERLRLVPYRGVNRGSQFMLALKPDFVRIEREGQVFVNKKVLVGLDGGKLTADSAYQAIIHPTLVQNNQ
ncbi:sigma-E processing peptidase SpoIIGA [Paenibacillus radicis (ex Gao et al. 2016)]|uniref:Sporulation sigma-E factor-processing peptidase n=1 Tax=Paenibacillus radicis (ex Gao et al. 2016) TaxID=1737354 RepID=A0A917HUW9_9BACL|nr:sigma-E processing peptidase SpoIIGA [Paenibacillus radicis (ex Gao et al. 2016)]GGG89892.1 sporulation sigma-E factor-processing peptidase [Paenibacillus radicis (ex Gao et al. 2016)]